MIEAIVYNSNTGFTKQYAYSFAVKTGLAIYSLKEIKKIKKGAHIIFFSWIMANKIMKLNKLKNYIVDMVCAVGMRPYSEEYIEDLKKENHLESLYYLRGGMRLYKLSLSQRGIMKIIRNSLIKKKKNNKITLEEDEILQWLEQGFERIDLNSLDPLVEWYKALNEEYVC